MPMPRENNNLFDNFRPHINKKSTLERPDIEIDDIDLISKIFDIRSYAKTCYQVILLKISYLKVSSHYF